MPIDLTAYQPIIQYAIPLILGVALKHGYGLVITKMHEFRAVIDDVDNVLSSGTATPEQQAKAIRDVQSLISKAQQL